MTPIDIAREKVIAAALSLVASRTYIDVSEPGPYDDSELELHSDLLNDALKDWSEIRMSGYDRSDEHVIQFDADGGWTIQHPLKERMNGSLFDCRITWHGQGVPEKFGRFVLLEGNVLGPEVG